MRVLLPVCLLATAVLAAPSLLPRSGAGWTGFKAGSWVKVKRTFQPVGGVPAVTIAHMQLLRVEAQTLTLRTTSENALRMKRSHTSKVPAQGEAGAGEKTRIKRGGIESLRAGKQLYECRKRTTTVSGPAGSRVITDWECADPPLRVKRIVVSRDAEGKQAETFSMVLQSASETRRYGRRTIRCLKYATLRKSEGLVQRGTALTSRAVPGDTVRMETQIHQNGKHVTTVLIDLVDYEAW